MGLRERINEIKIIDEHVHAFDLFYWIDTVGSYPFAFLLDIFPPRPNPLTTIPTKKMLMDVYREFYGFPHSELTPENEKELDELKEKSKKDEVKLYQKAMEMAGIEANIEMCLSKPELPPELDSKHFKKASLVDGFMLPLDNAGLKDSLSPQGGQFLTMCEALPKRVKGKSALTFEEYLNLISSTLANLQQKENVIALKMNFAYWRDIAVDAVEEDEARAIYKAKDTSPARYKRLQDFLLRHIIRSAGELDLPIQIHMGATGIAHAAIESDPFRLDPFLWLPDVKNTRIVILHGAYPFCHQAGFMAGRLPGSPRLFVDTSLIPSPKILSEVLREWIEMGIEWGMNGIIGKIMYSSDGVEPYMWLSAALNARQALYMTFKGMIDEGMIDEDQAVMMAKMILHDNAKNFYNL